MVWVVKPVNISLTDTSYHFKVVATDEVGNIVTFPSNFILRVGCPPEAYNDISFTPVEQ